MDGRRLDPLALELTPPVIADVGVAGGMGLHEQERPPRRERRHLAGHAPRAVFLRGGHEEENVAGRQDPLEEVAIVVVGAGALRPTGQRLRPTGQRLRPTGRQRRPRPLGVGIGAVNQHDVGHRGGVAGDDPSADLVERQPRAVDIAGHDHHRRHRRRPGDVAGGAHVPSGQRIHKRALASAGAPDDADDEDARELAAGPVEPRGDLLPLRPHAPGRGPVGERPAPPRKPGDEVVESGVVKPQRRLQRCPSGAVGSGLQRGGWGIGHRVNSRPQS